MFKKIVSIVLLLLMTPNVVEASSKIDNIVEHCSFFEEKSEGMDDEEINARIKKENDCLKQEIIKFIDLNVSNPEYKSQILQNLELAEKSCYDFLWLSSNKNNNCGDDDPLGVGCGTIAKYLVPEQQKRRILKIFLDTLVDIDDLREDVISWSTSSGVIKKD